MRPLLVLPLLVAAACGNGGGAAEIDAGMSTDPIKRCSGFVGDPALAVEVEAIVTTPEAYNEDGEISKIMPVMGTDGMRVPLVQAPQGGKHIFAGVRVRNIDTCPVSLLGAIRDTVSMRTKFESRPVDMLDGGDGWAYAADATQISGYANIPLCPNSWSERDVQEQTYRLELKVSDKGGRRGETFLSIVPFCGEPARESECIRDCSLGAPTPDAGAPR